MLHSFDSVSLSHLRTCYQIFVPDVNIIEIPQLCHKYRTAKWWSQYLKCSEYLAKMSTCILANWVGEDGCITEDPSVTSAGRIEYFLARGYELEVISITTLRQKWHV